MPKQYVVYKCLRGHETDYEARQILTKPTTLVITQKRRQTIDNSLAREEGDGRWFVGIMPYQPPTRQQRAWVYTDSGRPYSSRPVTVQEAQQLVNKHDGWSYHVINPVPNNDPTEE